MIVSSLSVILQRIYFKATHGKRIFKMSPLHHHFEKSGMTEPQIVAMYTAVTGVLSLVAVLTLI
jgi:phospho-N-acetylmuramoyl-pentapeptide-transferase